ncbi:MAG: hypothetical protein KDA44_13180 [Planctomycetales bacterium]|nr:hypothetical protein [Planctomycetales bacterium]
MARQYAVIMGLIGLSVVVLRAAKNGGGFENAVIHGVGWMGMFALIGGVIGALAQHTVDGAIRLRVERELKEIAAARAATAEHAEAAASGV